jgi:hypothetical protein
MNQELIFNYFAKDNFFDLDLTEISNLIAGLFEELDPLIGEIHELYKSDLQNKKIDFNLHRIGGTVRTYGWNSLGVKVEDLQKMRKSNLTDSSLKLKELIHEYKNVHEKLIH